MRSAKDVLAELNKDLPGGIDWHAGAQRYVQHYSKELGADSVEHYALTKPLVQMSRDFHYHRDLEENISYLYNFVNMLDLLWLPGGSNILDVACGGGWMSHFLTRMGYETFGFDISAEYVDLARRRIRKDPLAWVPDDKIDGMFAVHNIETTALGAEHLNRYDAIVLESCLHHFVDPIAALTNLAPCLKDDGLLFVIEGENRSDGFRDEHLDEMIKTETLERSYPRLLLEEIYRLGGVPHFEFFGDVNGWYSHKDPSSRNLVSLLDERSKLKNLSICAKSSDVLDKRFPWRVQGPDVILIPYEGLFDGSSDDGWRWSRPLSEIRMCRAVDSMTVEVLSEVPRALDRTQEIFAHGPTGLLDRVLLSPEAHYGRFHLPALNAGDSVTFSSGDFFVPTQSATGPDDRRLAFALRFPSN